jgi:hypothetical protein
VYSEVCEYFKDLGIGAKQNFNPIYTLYRSMPEDVLANIRKAVISNGIFGVGKLKNAFLTADKNHNGFLSRDEFVWCIKESGVDLTVNEFDKLFRYFDKNFDDQVSYREFVEFFS